jgi:hypothetical protein
VPLSKVLLDVSAMLEIEEASVDQIASISSIAGADSPGDVSMSAA